MGCAVAASIVATMFAEIIAIGSEMLTPERQDTNSLFLTAGLNEYGVTVAFKTIVGDNRQHLTDAIRIALGRADVVMLSGGLGPTEDDLTRECVAQALHLELHKDPELLVALVKRFAERRTQMPANNERQTEVLDGAQVLVNRKGSAPGQWLDVLYNGHRKIVVLLPGPPNELKALFDEECRPRLAEAMPPRFLARRQLRMAMIPESQVDARTAPIYTTYEDVETTILAGRGEIQLHLACVKSTREAAEARVNDLADRLEHEMGDDVFSSHGESLEEIALLMLGLHDMTLATAESMTGGWVGERLTSVPNTSRSYAGGVIVYTAEQKARLCGVPQELMEQHGVVSAEVARAMAEGIREKSGASLGLSITGIAGPRALEGADAGKAVGLTYIALASSEGTQVRELSLTGERDRIRLWATQHALEMLRRHLL